MADEDRHNHVLDSIDGALAAYEDDMPDAMRWVPPDARDDDEPEDDPYGEPMMFGGRCRCVFCRVFGDVTRDVIRVPDTDEGPMLLPLRPAPAGDISFRLVRNPTNGPSYEELRDSIDMRWTLEDPPPRSDHESGYARDVPTASSLWDTSDVGTPLENLIAWRDRMEADQGRRPPAESPWEVAMRLARSIGREDLLNYRPRVVLGIDPAGDAEDTAVMFAAAPDSVWLIPEEPEYGTFDLDITRAMQELADAGGTPLRYRLRTWVGATGWSDLSAFGIRPRYDEHHPRPLAIDGREYARRRRGRRSRR